jgi:hypothetical protein
MRGVVVALLSVSLTKVSGISSCEKRRQATVDADERQGKNVPKSELKKPCSQNAVASVLPLNQPQSQTLPQNTQALVDMLHKLNVFPSSSGQTNGYDQLFLHNGDQPEPCADVVTVHSGSSTRIRRRTFGDVQLSLRYAVHMNMLGEGSTAVSPDNYCFEVCQLNNLCRLSDEKSFCTPSGICHGLFADNTITIFYQPSLHICPDQPDTVEAIVC